ncbi:50S ribosomal protein L13 [Patescibacteria group bacterium]|nr:50S ribosomal protein L13 [Patescibacteria group bacterium]MBU0963642.1 50S ribosomal protein L13 [Patescibacteria group bacterium]
MIQKKRRQFKVDAANRSIGRVASEVANLVIGKKEPDYAPNILPNIYVTVLNIEKVKISEKKLNSKIYYHHSGYPGGLKETLWRDIFKKSPKNLFLLVIKNMLPNNKLRREILKHINF